MEREETTHYFVRGKSIPRGRHPIKSDWQQPPRKAAIRRNSDVA